MSQDAVSTESADEMNGRTIDWSRVDPLRFLDILARRSPDAAFWILAEPPQDWIQEAHVEKLLEKIDSTEPAAPVVSVLSSFAPIGTPSTVGREALFLIAGFREGRYPPRLASLHFFEPDATGTRGWWASRNR